MVRLDGPTGCVEALLTALAQWALGSITVCAVLLRGNVRNHECHKNLQRVWGMGPGVRKDQRRWTQSGDIAFLAGRLC